MLKNLPALPKGSAVHRASRSASHPYIRHDQQHLSPSHALSPQRNRRYNDTSPRKSSDMTRSLRTSDHSLRVVSTLHCSTNRQQSSPRHSSQPSRLESKRSVYAYEHINQYTRSRFKNITDLTRPSKPSLLRKFSFKNHPIGTAHRRQYNQST